MNDSAKPLATRLDPIDFEILRHRLWAINDESSATVRLVSGSPTASAALALGTPKPGR